MRKPCISFTDADPLLVLGTLGRHAETSLDKHRLREELLRLGVARVVEELLEQPRERLFSPALNVSRIDSVPAELLSHSQVQERIVHIILCSRFSYQDCRMLSFIPSQGPLKTVPGLPRVSHHSVL